MRGPVGLCRACHRRQLSPAAGISSSYAVRDGVASMLPAALFKLPLFLVSKKKGLSPFVPPNGQI